MPKQRAAWLGLTVAVVLIALAFALPHLLDWDVHTRTKQSPAPAPVTPPLHGWWEPKWWGPGTLPALLIAVLGLRHAADLAQRLPWRRLLAASYVAGLAWLVSLALVEGTDGLGSVLGHSSEYLVTARAVDDVPALLDGFIDKIPVAADDNWPIHVAGHPPGALLFFVALVRVGLGADLAAGLVVIAVAATIPLAVLTVLRTLGAEELARRAAPFLVLTPAAVFLAVSADAVFAAVGAWGAAALALAARADRGSRPAAMAGWGVVAGLLLGYGVFLSYGFALLGGVALATLLAQRSWRPVLVVVPAALAVVGVFAALGFAWWEAYPVLVDRYWDGIASDRPASYWWWGNLAALLVSAGPLVGAGLAHTAAVARTAERAGVLLVAGGALGVAAADASGMSRSEVERIWLIFIPWLTVACALLPDRWRRWGLGLQVVTALAVTHLLYTSW
ncbi:MAG TPA: hypothetical protein VNS46_14740 [Nocardioides sp.]|nr:hypothetical protein [Nocardioides sp.]